MTVEDSNDFLRILKMKRCNVRSIYATANIYRSIREVSDLYDFSNILHCTPTWDVDGELSNWRETISIAEELISYLKDWGLEKSVYIKWSGNGCHVHIHEGAFSQPLLQKYHPLNITYAVVEYVNSKLSERFRALSHGKGIKVENKIDLTRVFTCPLLSLIHI